MPKSFSIKRKSGYQAGTLTIERAKMDNACGCGALIKCGSKKVVFLSSTSYPIAICKKCAGKLIAVLKQVET